MQAKLYVFGKQCIEPTFCDNLHIPLAGSMRPGIEDILDKINFNAHVQYNCESTYKSSECSLGYFHTELQEALAHDELLTVEISHCPEPGLGCWR